MTSFWLYIYSSEKMLNEIKATSEGYKQNLLKRGNLNELKLITKSWYYLDNVELKSVSRTVLTCIVINPPINMRGC